MTRRAMEPSRPSDSSPSMAPMMTTSASISSAMFTMIEAGEPMSTSTFTVDRRVSSSTRSEMTFAALRAKHPTVDIESCAAGGGRIDYEILRHVQRFWPSDNNDALERQAIQRGFSYFYPPEVMGAHIGAKKSHSTRRVSDIHFRGITALFGHLGIELDPLQASEEDKAVFSRYIEVYKKYRQLIHEGTLYRLDSDDAQAQTITSIVSADRRQALVTVAQLAMPTWALSGALRLQGLDPQATYRVSVIDSAANFSGGIVSTQPAWVADGIELSGDWLQHAGLAMPVLDAESALLILLEAQH